MTPTPFPPGSEAEKYSLRWLTQEPNRPLEFLFQGLLVRIECRKGDVREKPGKFTRLMNCDYGEIVGVPGADGDFLDCYVGPNLDSPLVFVIAQMRQDGSFDENKAMLGFDSKDEAESAYLSHYPRDWTGLGPIDEMPAEAFAEWCQKKDAEPDMTEQYSLSRARPAIAYARGSLAERYARLWSV